jgi:HD-GYP domain-containing protein (c-di-GMP phosphodiesterase class II)
MTPPTIFLTALAHAFSAIGLYGEGHPAREKSLDLSMKALDVLFNTVNSPTFSFVHGEVIFGTQPLRDLKGWALAGRLQKREIQRIQFNRGVGREELSLFLVRLSGAGEGRFWSTDSDEFRYMRFGPVSMKGEDEQKADFKLPKQVALVDELHDDAKRKGKISSTLARTVVDTISRAMRSQSRLLVPLVPLKKFDQYTTVHSMNTSVLSMALGEYMDMAGSEVRMIGEAALLHDVGKTIVPPEILNKPGALDEKEWEHIKRHPVEGARILMRSGDGLDLAIIAAYEHHLKLTGGGYPELNYVRKPHRISQLIHLCDAYDAMRTNRPFQDAYNQKKIFKVLLDGAGTDYAPDLVKWFVNMMKKWDKQVVIADGDEIIPDGP